MKQTNKQTQRVVHNLTNEMPILSIIHIHIHDYKIDTTAPIQWTHIAGTTLKFVLPH